jgi:hypothetical protein
MSILRSALVVAVMGAPFVMPAARADDLAGTVAAKLRESGTLSGYRVNVKSKSGTIWLEGRVADQKQLESAVSLAENTPGVERVVNRLSIGGQADAPANPKGLGLPPSVWGVLGVPQPAGKAEPQVAAAPAGRGSQPAPRGLLSFGGQDTNQVQLTQALAPSGRSVSGGNQGNPAAGTDPRRAAQPQRSNTPRPLGVPMARSMPPAPTGKQGQPPRTAMRGPVQRTSMRSNMQGDAMQLPVPNGYDGPMPGAGPIADGQMVPGSMRVVDNGSGGGYADGGYAANCPPGAGGYGAGGGGAGGMGGPMPMGGTGVGLPPIPGRGDGPNVPNYAWPSYSAYPNYAAVQYPTQYSPTAWPYIGPFYPYPQVPLGWRRVSLEWDDGWWWLDFDERHIHSHHR